MKISWPFFLTAGVAALALSGCSSSNPPPPPSPVPPPPVAASAAPLPAGLSPDQLGKLRSAAPDTAQRVETAQPLTTDDVKALAKIGFNSDLMISVIGNSHTIFHLSANDIIDLAHSGVNSRVIDFMVATPSSVIASSPPTGDQGPMVPPPGTPPPPPPPSADNTPPPPAPGPDYVWADGDWVWNGAWVWVGPHWVLPPYPGAVWYHHGWVRGGWGRGYYGHRRGYWR